MPYVVPSRPRVILRHCPDYDPARIRGLAREALVELGLRPHGRTLVKPNCVASGELFPHAHTRKEFLRGVLQALKDRAGLAMDELALGERCGITIPTRRAYAGAGYYELPEQVPGLKLYHFEEEPQVEIPLYHPGRLRDSLFTPRPVAEADFFVNCPKFKAHPWTTVTFSLKNYIGIQDDRHRLIDHDHKLNEKVADLQYVVQPKFIAIDAIIAGEGRMLTPVPFPLKLVIFGDNQVAVDAVCSRIIGVDPLSVDHIRLCYERGFGPVAPEAIDISGDVSFDEARQRAQGFRVGLVRVEEYFQGTRIQAHSGPPPAPPPGHKSEEYCWGGCPGALEEAIEILRLFDADTDAKMPPMHIVFGAYDGPIDAKSGEKVVFMGDCATFKGAIGGRPVNLESRYRDRSTLNPHEARHSDVFAKMGSMALKTHMVALREALNRSDGVIRVDGCPVSVAEQVLLLVGLSGAKNPLLDPRESALFTQCYLSWRTRTALHRILGIPYQLPGPARRGDGRPALNLPPEGVATPLEQPRA